LNEALASAVVCCARGEVYAAIVTPSVEGETESFRRRAAVCVPDDPTVILMVACTLLGPEVFVGVGVPLGMPPPPPPPLLPQAASATTAPIETTRRAVLIITPLP
jgi:hypothetical protein